jgi:hypothetical protein
MLLALVGDLSENKSVMWATNLAFVNFFMFGKGLDFEYAEGVFDIAKASAMKFGNYRLFWIVSLEVHRTSSK